MKLRELSIRGAYVVESPVWRDERGHFREWYRTTEFENAGVNFPIAQANLSVSRRGVVRGLHYSLAPDGQAKLVTCAYGELDDVIVDVREGSPSFAQVEVVHLAAGDDRSVLVPGGAAHGFCVTSEIGALTYLLSSPFDGPRELEITPFDESLNILWPLEGEPVLSEKDANAPTLAQRRAAHQLPTYPGPRA